MLTIEEIDAVEKAIAFREAGNDPAQDGSLQLLQSFYNMSDAQLEKHVSYFKRALSKHFGGTANYERLEKELQEYARAARKHR